MYSFVAKSVCVGTDLQFSADFFSGVFFSDAGQALRRRAKMKILNLLCCRRSQHEAFTVPGMI